MVGVEKKKKVSLQEMSYFTFPVNIYSHTFFPDDMKNVKQGYKVSCIKSLQKFNVLPLVSEHLFSLLSFVTDNMKQFQINLEITV